MVWIKFLHIATIAIWTAGLIALPGLYVQRVHINNDESLYRLQALVRYAYVTLISPAAFVAVGSGTALVLMAETFAPWFHLKLFLVAILVGLHVLSGLVIIRLFSDGEVYPVWRFVLVTIATILIATLIIATVLLKPDIGTDFMPAALLEPGGLRVIATDLIDRFE